MTHQKQGGPGDGAVIFSYTCGDGGMGVTSFLEPGIYEWSVSAGRPVEAEVVIVAAGEVGNNGKPGRAGKVFRGIVKTVQPVAIVVGSVENNMSQFGDVVVEGYESLEDET